MADLETASAGKFRYRRLRYSEEFEEAFGRCRGGGGGGEGISKRWRRRRWWFRMKMRKGSSSLSIARRLKKLRIPSLRKLLRRKWRLVNAMRGSIAKVLKRFRDGEAYLGDLFAGNYLFLQVNPSAMKCLKNHHHHHHRHHQHGFDVRNFPQTNSLPSFT